MKVSQIDIKIYTDFYNSQENDLNIYSHPLWFFGMSNKPYVLGCYNDEGELMAIWPFNVVKRFPGIKCLSQPMFCQSLGPIFQSPGAEGLSMNSVISRQRKIISSFLEFIHSSGFRCISQGLPIGFSMAQYFHHYGLELNYRISYRISPDRTSDELWSQLHADHRRKIRKASEKYTLCKRLDPEDLWELKEKTLSTHQKDLYPSRDSFCSAVDELRALGKGQLVGLKDENGNWKSGVFLAEDDLTVYFLVGFTEKNSDSESPSLPLLWHGIDLALKAKKSFDFEGTMVARLDRNFRRFVPEAVPYARIEWDSSLLGQLKSAWQRWRKSKFHISE